MIIVPLDVESKRHGTQDEYLLVLNRTCGRSEFVDAATVVAGTYAEELVQWIYDCTVAQAIDVLAEYRRYYTDEYATVADFLYWKYNADPDSISRALKELGPQDFLGYGSVYWGGDYNLGQFVMSEEGLDMLGRIFGRLKEAGNEGQA